MIDEAATLTWLADQACITPHTLLSRADRLDRPDRLIFDLDPPGDAPAAVRTSALLMRDLLEDLGLSPFVMATGSKGAHVVVALDRAAGFDETRRFARDVAGVLAARHPKALTVETRRAKRDGRVYLDIQRNGYAQSAVAPYAVRPIRGAPVAVPLRWEEVEDRRFDPRRHTLRTTPERARREGDPWSGMARRGRSLREPSRRLDAMLRDEAG
jgi:bifunctional non-homologous end joining protein LigD